MRSCRSRSLAWWVAGVVLAGSAGYFGFGSELLSQVYAAPVRSSPGTGEVMSPAFAVKLEHSLKAFNQPTAYYTGTNTLTLEPNPVEPQSANSGCGESGCAYSFCWFSDCYASGCLGSWCGSSLCLGSACGLSLCGGSLCLGSACFGSFCGGTACYGSYCYDTSCPGTGYCMFEP
jgi:hypothetical protein